MGAYMAYLIIDKKHPQEKVESFFRQLITGQQITNITINTLRDRLYGAKTGNYKLSNRYKRAIIVKTWNAYITGAENTRLRWSEKTEMPEFI